MVVPLEQALGATVCPGSQAVWHELVPKTIGCQDDGKLQTFTQEPSDTEADGQNSGSDLWIVLGCVMNS